MTNYERTVDNVVGGVEKAAGCLEAVQSGCVWAALHLIWMVMLGAALFMGYRSWRFTVNGVQVIGTVVENEAFDGADGVSYTPVVEYEVNGQTYRISGDNSSSPPAYRVGQQVRVRYDPADPQRGQIDNWYEKWLGPVGLGCAAGLMALIVTGVMAYKLIRRQSLVLETD